MPLKNKEKTSYVIGNCLAAALYAHYNNYNLILTSVRGPFEYDLLKCEVPTFSGKNENDVWSVLVFELAMAGQVPHGKRVESVRVTNDEIVVSMGNINVKCEYDKCFIFDCEKVSFPNEVKKIRKSKYRVLDWFSVRSGMLHDKGKLETEEQFVKDLIFYISKRIPGNKTKKDAVAVSYMTEEQLRDFDYSDTMAKFKVEDLMRRSGIKGSVCSKNIGSKPKHYSIKVEHSHREVLKIEGNEFIDTGKVVFLKLTPEKIVEEHARERS